MNDDGLHPSPTPSHTTGLVFHGLKCADRTFPRWSPNSDSTNSPSAPLRYEPRWGQCRQTAMPSLISTTTALRFRLLRTRRHSAQWLIIDRAASWKTCLLYYPTPLVHTPRVPTPRLRVLDHRPLKTRASYTTPGTSHMVAYLDEQSGSSSTNFRTDFWDNTIQIFRRCITEPWSSSRK